MKSSYSKITAAMEKLLYFWVDISDKRATNSTGIRANWLNCLLNILKVLLHLHNFPLLNINCTEPCLGPLYRSDIIVQILNCKIPERGLLNGATCKRFQRFHAGEDVRPVTSCKFLLGSVHGNGIEKYRASEYSPLILKLQVTFTKRLSFKTTFKGHSIIKYLNHAYTKHVINTQNQSQIWIYF